MRKETKLALSKQKPEHFVRWTGAQVVIGGKLLSEDELRTLRAEVNAIRGSRIWRILHENVLEDGKKRVFEASANLAQLNYGKAIIHTLQMQDNLMDAILKSAGPMRPSRSPLQPIGQVIR